MTFKPGRPQAALGPGSVAHSLVDLGLAHSRPHEGAVDEGGDRHPHEPGHVVEGHEEGRHVCQHPQGGQEAGHGGQHAQHHGHQGGRVPAILVPVLSALPLGVEGVHVECTLAHQPVVRHHDADDGPQQGAVAHQPGVDEAGAGGDQLPGHDDEADGGCDEAAQREGDDPGGHVDKGVGGGHDVCGDVGGQGGPHEAEEGGEDGQQPLHLAQQLHRVNDGLAVNHHSGASHRQA
mmetsp:Transcript_23671/g.51938  ORF Transcript_23671/g.51938 Transcript_23671/m.51938 type:complete len:234 (-) Transcript_23671:1059-1760(-)